ncbi:DUF1002 domain-containing protein [uncultured Granulicatella sp.]|uniref:DUF1002 domain-containing protein n=1 Tax=uncultured Granulicatella sp. TaxID=316089 RepID=UPI0028DB4501|nr:DUF1002 domain-containing protein [uncultured Granulicatella sp.]
MKKIVRPIVVATMLLGLISQQVYAIDTTAVNEKWGKPTVVYGGGLNDQQIKETSKLLGIKDENTVTTTKATGEDLVKYLGAGEANTSVMISSVMVQKRNKGEGVKVHIATPKNITLVTSEQYANAAITAGVADAEIEVAAVSKVTGESALTGVYKAFEANGIVLDEKRTAVAQKELELTNQIAQEQSKEKGFDAAKLDQAMIDIKKSLAEIKEKQGQVATKEDVERIVNEALKKYGLDKVISPTQVNNIIQFALSYQQTSAIDSKQVLEQLNSLSNIVKGKIGQLVNQANREGWLDKIVTFFKEIFNAIFSSK